LLFDDGRPAYAPASCFLTRATSGNGGIALGLNLDGRRVMTSLASGDPMTRAKDETQLIVPQRFTVMWRRVPPSALRPCPILCTPRKRRLRGNGVRNARQMGSGHTTKFDWDEGNRGKCARRVSLAEIEALIDDPRTLIAGDPYGGETRFRAIGHNADGRPLFVVFTMRVKMGEMHVRPISARYRHRDKGK